MKLLIENWRAYCLLSESKQKIKELMGDEFPDVVASLFIEEFGNKSFTIAKWMKDYYQHRVDTAKKYGGKWWEKVFDVGRGRTLLDLIELYVAANKSAEEYKAQLEYLDIESEDFIDENYLAEQKIALKQQIKEILLGDIFFRHYALVQDILNKSLTDIAPYKKMPLRDANKAYEEKKVFDEEEPITAYEEGYRWINVGNKCNLVGNLMKNCGSSGVMSLDEDRTMIVLFDKNNKPHVVVTYSPNQKRISGDEGQASSRVKDEYSDYVLDLADILGAEFDSTKTKSKLLGIKYRLKGITSDIERVPFEGQWNEYFKVVIDGQTYYGNANSLMKEEDLMRVKDILLRVKDILLNQENKPRVIGLDLRKQNEEYTLGEIIHAAFYYRNANLIKRFLPDLEPLSTFKLALEKERNETPT